MSGDDPVWGAILEEASKTREASLAGFLDATILGHERLEGGLAYLLAEKLASSRVSAEALREVFGEVFDYAPEIGSAARADLEATRTRDAASDDRLGPFLFFKGFHALESHRVAHWLWRDERRTLARYIQNRSSERFGVDIHPAARTGQGIFIDHGTGIVVGETAVIEDDVSMLQGVTLGGTGKETGDRHPKVRSGVLLSAGAGVFGNIEIGEGAKVGAGSVVLHDVPPHCTVAGVPAKVVGKPGAEQPALEMDQSLPEHAGEGI